MYVQVKANINELIWTYENTPKDLIALQLQAIKDTGHAKDFELDFSDFVLTEGNTRDFMFDTLRKWLLDKGFVDTLETVLKRIESNYFDT